MTKKICAVLLTVCVLMLTGCSCEHVWAQANCVDAKTCTKCQETKGTALGHDWQDATCEIPKTCARCGETDGQPLGHSPEERSKIVDAVSACMSIEESCQRCDVLISSETSPLDTLVQNDLFLFTPEQFMERLSLVAQQHSDQLTYTVDTSIDVLQVSTFYNGHKGLIQFFHADSSPMIPDEYKTAKVWCVSLSEIDQSNIDLRKYFFMACDPALDTDSASKVDIDLAVAYVEAAMSNYAYGFLLNNQLLYQESYIAEGELGQDFSLYMVNVYASDFR